MVYALKTSDEAIIRAIMLHKYVFRPPRPTFQYRYWMNALADLDQHRRRGKRVDGNALREAYEAGLQGDLDAVDSFVGLTELAMED